MFVGDTEPSAPVAAFAELRRVWLVRRTPLSSANILAGRLALFAEACSRYTRCLAVDFRDVLFQRDAFASANAALAGVGAEVLLAQTLQPIMIADPESRMWMQHCWPHASLLMRMGHERPVSGGALMATACDFRVISDNVVLRIPELALGIPNVWNGTPLLAREVGLPTARDWVMTTRKVRCDELKQSGWAQRVAIDDALEDVTEQLIGELLAVPAAALAMTRSMTSALGRSASGMAMGWADADLQQWALTEEEYKETVRSYAKQLASK